MVAICLLTIVLASTTPTSAYSISYAIINPGPSTVDAGTSVTLEVRATFDAPLVAGRFTISAAGTPEAVVTGRSANQLEGNGLSYVPKTYPIPTFYNDLPHNLASQGALRETLMDLDPIQDGVPPGTDVLVETIQVVPYGVGTLTISITGPSAATTWNAPDGAMFASAAVDPSRATVVLEVIPPLDCSAQPPPDPNHPDTDGDGVPDVCDVCPGHDDTQDADNDTIPDGCDLCPDFHDLMDFDRDGVADACDNCPNDSNPGQEDADGDEIGDVCDPQLGPLFDYDMDGDVDQTDFARMQACYTGNGQTVSQLFPDGRCDALDVDGDGYVRMDNGNNLGDLGWFERCASGPGIAAASDCGDCDGHGVLDARVNPPDPWVANFDFDSDGIQVLGRPTCTGGQTTDCDDRCPCHWDPDQLDSDGDGIGDACDSTPYGPPEPEPPLTIQVLAWRSMREHGTGNWLGVTLDPALTADSATVEPRQGSVQVIEADLSDAAGASSDLESVLVFDDEFNFITPNDVYLDSGDTRVVITFIDDPMVDDDFLLDQKCYLIDLSLAIVDTEGDPPIGDADCAIRMLAADADGNAIVEQADVSAIAAANGQTAGSSNVRLDVNVDGFINATDESIASSLLNNTVTCPGGMMMMGMGGCVGPTGGADALVGTSDASLAPESFLGPSGRGFPSSLPPNAERIPRTEAARKGFRAKQDLLTLLRQQQVATPSANVSAQWVVHGTGATSVTLPAEGGTVAVDLMVTTDAPIWGFEGKPAVDAANVVSIDSADWTELDNVLMSYGQTVTSAEEAASQPPTTLASYYDLTVMDWLWVRLTPDGSDVTAWGMDVDSLLGADPPTVWALTQDLTAVNGPIATPTAEPPIQSQESVQWFTTTASIGGVTREPLPAGQTTLATLALTISPEPGTYHLTLTDAQFVDTIHVTHPATTGQPLVIVVGQ